MKTLTYQGHEGVELWDGRKPKPGDAVAMTDAQAAELLARNADHWKEPDAPAPAKRSTK